MKDQLCQAFCDNLLVRQVPAGFAVSTAFQGTDGDRIGFYIRKQIDGGFRLEDDGFTLPMLEASGLDFASGSRGKAMRELLSEYGVIMDEESRGFAVNNISEECVPQVAMRFVAFSLRVRDFVLMTEPRVQGTFREDVARMLAQSVGTLASVEEKAVITENLNDFPADFVLRRNGRRPVGVYLGTTEAKVLEAVFVQMRALHEEKVDCAVIALLERSKNISPIVRRTATNRLTSVVEFRGDEVASIQRIVHEAVGSSVAVH